MIIRGIETVSLISVNFSPMKEASNVVIGILHTAAAPIYVKITESFAPFFIKVYMQQEKQDKALPL